MAAGFGPVAPSPAAPQRLTRSLAAALDLLAAQPAPATAADLASQAGQHRNTMRGHLEELVTARLATRRRADARTRGRPAWLYAARTAGADQPVVAREYAGLATALATQLAHTSRRPGEDAVRAGETWGAQLAQASPGQVTSSPMARRRVVRLLGGLGFAPTADVRATVVRLRRCPLLEAARQQPDVVCGVHLGIVRGALADWGAAGQHADLVPFAEPGACLLHLPAPANEATTS